MGKITCFNSIAKNLRRQIAMQRKKGFTLIELIAAIAILSIAMVGICSAVYTGTNISAKNSKKLNTSVFANNMIQALKTENKDNLGENYNFSNEKPMSSCYCYFDNEDELQKLLKTKIDVTNSANLNLKSGSEEDMKGNVGKSDKKFGAFLQLNLKTIKDKEVEDINFLRIFVKVIKLKALDMAESSLVFYLGR